MPHRRILVTGGAGFVGSHLVDSILKSQPNSHVVIADNFFLGHEKNLASLNGNERCVIERVDVSSQSALFSLISNFKIDTVWNLAVVPLPTSLIYPEWTVQNNINCALAVCEAARFFKNLRVVNVSSSETYGTAVDVPMREDHLFKPETPYAASKAAADMIFNSYASTFNLRFLTLRPFNMFGPRQNRGSYAGVVPIFIDRILKHQDITIFGDGTQTRDFVYVKDSVNAMLEAESKWSGDESVTLNIATGIETSVNQLLEYVSQGLGKRAERVLFGNARDGDVSRHCGDATRYKEFTGKSIPGISLETIQETIDWYKSDAT